MLAYVLARRFGIRIDVAEVGMDRVGDVRRDDGSQSRSSVNLWMSSRIASSIPSRAADYALAIGFDPRPGDARPTFGEHVALPEARPAQRVTAVESGPLAPVEWPPTLGLLARWPRSPFVAG